MCLCSCLVFTVCFSLISDLLQDNLNAFKVMSWFNFLLLLKKKKYPDNHNLREEEFGLQSQVTATLQGSHRGRRL